MVKAVALDSNAAIILLNNQTDIDKIIANFDVIYLPATVCGELLFGAKNSKNAATNETRYLVFINDYKLLEINLMVAEVYSLLRLELKMKGKPIPENDIWIAATCIANNIPLLTLDKHFANITGLTVLPTTKD